jgi:osmotically-inducible protein OsmY
MQTTKRKNSTGSKQKAAHPDEVPAASDRIVKRAIQARLKDGYDAVKVGVRDGYVTLDGVVRSFRLKEALHRFVMSLRGVRALKDGLRVNPAENLHDQSIALLVRHALDAHAELPFGTAEIKVERGVVTLHGYVRTLDERGLAENVASHCRGVAKVVNDLTVDPLEEVSDEAAARAVSGALAYCEDFETDGVVVTCNDGNLSLRGAVPTMMDRTLCEELARLQGGVRSVENRIVVQSGRPGKPRA